MNRLTSISLRGRLTAALAALGAVVMSTGLVGLTATSAQADPKGDSLPAGYYICQATSSPSNPYRKITPDAQGVINGQDNGVVGVFEPGMTNQDTWGDIIMPVTVAGTTYQLNWSTEGQSIYGNDCQVGGGGTQPAAQVVTSTQTQNTCAGVETRTETVTTPYTWDGAAWVLDAGNAATTDSDWTVTGPVTGQQKQSMNCPEPDQPADQVVATTLHRASCGAGEEQQTETVTTPYVFDVDSWTWVLGSPQAPYYGAWTYAGPLTTAEQQRLGCNQQPAQPNPEVDHSTQQQTTCADGVERRVVTITTPYAWSGSAWVLGNPQPPVFGAWTHVRNLTRAEQVALDCNAQVKGTQGHRHHHGGSSSSDPKPASSTGKHRHHRGTATAGGSGHPAATVLPSQAVVPTAVDAGLASYPVPTGTSAASWHDAGLVGGGLLMLVAAGGIGLGRRTRGAREV